MSKPIETKAPGFKLRIHVHPSVIHAFSSTEPIVTRDAETGRIKHIEITQDEESGYGDFIGYIDWSLVGYIAWRKTEEPKPAKKAGRPSKIDLHEVSKLVPIDGEIRKSELISLVCQKFNASERTTREAIELLVSSKEIVVAREEPREGGGLPNLWISRSPTAEEVDAFFANLKSKLD